MTPVDHHTVSAEVAYRPGAPDDQANLPTGESERWPSAARDSPRHSSRPCERVRVTCEMCVANSSAFIVSGPPVFMAARCGSGIDAYVTPTPICNQDLSAMCSDVGDQTFRKVDLRGAASKPMTI